MSRDAFVVEALYHLSVYGMLKFTGDMFRSLSVKGENTLQEVTDAVVIHHDRNCFVPAFGCQHDQLIGFIFNKFLLVRLFRAALTVDVDTPHVEIYRAPGRPVFSFQCGISLPDNLQALN